MTTEAAHAIRHRSELLDFAEVLVHPTAVIERVLARENRRVVPIVIAAILSGALEQGSFASLKGASPAAATLAIVAAAFVVAAAFLLAVFFAFAWVLRWIARLFEGDGEVRDISAALAWGLAPSVWAVVYRLPVALFTDAFTPARIRAGRLTIELSNLAMDGWPTALMIGTAELAIVVWTCVVSVMTLSVVLKVGPARAFGALLATLAVPVVVVIAFVLALAV